MKEGGKEYSRKEEKLYRCRRDKGKDKRWRGMMMGGQMKGMGKEYRNNEGRR
jgi:hypothetical protein